MIGLRGGFLGAAYLFCSMALATIPGTAVFYGATTIAEQIAINDPVGAAFMGTLAAFWAAGSAVIVLYVFSLRRSLDLLARQPRPVSGRGRRSNR